MRTLSLGYSPCPNDTFIFYALTHGKVETEDLSFRETLLDVETLNQRAMQSSLDVTKISYHAFGHIHEKYCLLRAGGALGRGCGPLVIAKEDYAMEELKGKRIAIPGAFTTAFLLLQLYDPSFTTHTPDISIMPFDKIIEEVAAGNADAGLIIHESRFTYPAYGLKQILDLGAWWEEETALPIPLGGIIARRSLGNALHKKVNNIVSASVQYALRSPADPLTYVKEHSQELSDDVITQHINLYVNEFSIDVGSEGEQAVTELLSRASERGIIPRVDQSFFA